MAHTVTVEDNLIGKESTRTFTNVALAWDYIRGNMYEYIEDMSYFCDTETWRPEWEKLMRSRSNDDNQLALAFFNTHMIEYVKVCIDSKKP